MKTYPVRLLLSLVPLALLGSVRAASYKDHLGMQIWSLRETAKESPQKALDLVKSYGMTEVETAGPGFGTLTPEAYVAEMKSRGLVAIGAHVGYEALEKDVAAEIAKAKILGAHYIVCPWIPHKGGEPLSIEQAQKVAVDFQTWGKAIHEAGLQFGWHPHGFEFVKGPAGASPFEIIVNGTTPETLVLEMDVFWVFHAGQDPAQLLEKYPDRWRLMHVKDIRKGAVTHLSTGSAPPTDNVPVGDGQIDWVKVFTTADKIGVEYYFIEDETPAPLQCIPASLKYLHGLKL